MADEDNQETESEDTPVESGDVAEESSEAADSPPPPESNETAEEEAVGTGIDGTKQIMVVEDTAAVRRIVIKFLTNANYGVIEATNGREALEKLKNPKIPNPDLILLDLMMPVMDGQTFLQRLRANDTWKDVPVCILTAKSERSMVLDCLRIGAQEFIIKPFTHDTIMERVSKCIGESAPADVKVGDRTEVQKIKFDSAPSAREKVEVLILRVRTLLALPFAVVKIARICTQDDSSAKDLEQPVQSDPAVAAVILGRANSAAYRGNEKIIDITKAVTRIGMKETRNIAVTFSVMKLFGKDDVTDGFTKVNFWIHSLSTGVLSQAVGSGLKHEEAEDAFMGGLLHDIGKMVFDDFLPEEFAKSLRLVQGRGVSVKEAEQQVFETTHAYMGGMLVEKWGFPKPIVETILDHHKTDRFGSPPDPLPVTALVVIGNTLAKALYLGNAGDDILDRRAMALFGILQDKGVDWRALLSTVAEEMQSFLDLLDVKEAYANLAVATESKGKVCYLELNGDPASYAYLLEIMGVKFGFDVERFDSAEACKSASDGALAVVVDCVVAEASALADAQTALKDSEVKCLWIADETGVEGVLPYPTSVTVLLTEILGEGFNDVPSAAESGGSAEGGEESEG